MDITPWEQDINVLIIFFVREDVLKETFEAVRKARPRRLLLWQDGAREGRKDDVEDIEKCRKIVENIDWKCEVYKNYQTKNWGCDPSTFYSHKWAFSVVDKCIILEDDCCPSQSFFRFCKEMLDKYENDERISRIIGMNNLGVYEDTPYDYFYAKTGSCGWATWKRVAKTWDETYSFLNDNYHMNLLLANNGPAFQKYWYLCKKHSETPHWETIVGMSMLLNSSMNIISKKNLIKNIGITENATHTVSDKRLIPSKHMKFYNLESYELSFPLNHPPYVVESKGYMKKFKNVLSSTWINKLELLYRMIRYNRFDLLWNAIKKRI